MQGLMFVWKIEFQSLNIAFVALEQRCVIALLNDPDAENSIPRYAYELTISILWFSNRNLFFFWNFSCFIENHDLCFFQVNFE